MRKIALPMMLFVALILLTGAQPSAASTVTVDQIDRGWFRHDGGHNPLNKNTITGMNGNGSQFFRSFFVFDLTGVSFVTAATFRLEIEAYFGPDPSETFDVFAVSTTAAELGTSFPDGSPVGMQIYEDLGTGPVYAWEVTVTPSDVGSVFDITLTASALADINASLGGTFAVGLKLREPYTLPSGDEAVRFSWGDEPRVHQLVLETGAVSVETASWADVKALYHPADE